MLPNARNTDLTALPLAQLEEWADGLLSLVHDGPTRRVREGASVDLTYVEAEIRRRAVPACEERAALLYEARTAPQDSTRYRQIRARLRQIA